MEVLNRVDGHLIKVQIIKADIIGQITHANQISNTPAGNIAATDVQAAINELDTEKANATYTNSTPTTQDVGGIPAGSTFSAVPLPTVLDSLLHPYLAPLFSAFTMTGQATSVEVGVTISGSKSFSWTASNSGNVQTNSVKISQNSTDLVTGLPASGSTSTTVQSTQLTAPGSHSWTLTGTDTHSNPFTRLFTVNWMWRVYVGTSTNASLNETQIEALAGSNSLASTPLATYTLAAGGYKYFAYPVTMPAASSFTDTSTQLTVDMATSADDAAYSNTANGLSYAVVSVTNASGQTVGYRVYRTKFQLGGSINIRIA